MQLIEVFSQKQEKIKYFQVNTDYFFRTDHILDHKINLNKLNKIEIIQGMFSVHNGIK